MGGGLFVIQGDGSLVELREQPYDSEALLQELLARYPNLLAGDQIDPDTPRRWLLVSREAIFPTYTREGFEAAFKQSFNIREAIPVRESERVLYLMESL